MKKLVYSLLVLCSAGLLVWACNSMDDSVAVTDLEESLEIVTPNGFLLAENVASLKTEISQILQLSCGFELIAIEHIEVKYGYAAMVYYLLDDENIGAVAIVKGDEYSNTDRIIRVKSSSESGVTGDKYYYYCERKDPNKKICNECAPVINIKTHLIGCKCYDDCVLRFGRV